MACCQARAPHACVGEARNSTRALSRSGLRGPRRVHTSAARAAAATWEGYRAEVLSGALAWGPAHGSPDFWAAHAAKLEDRDLQACRVGGGGVGVGGGVGGGRGWAERWAVGGVG